MDGQAGEQTDSHELYLKYSLFAFEGLPENERLLLLTILHTIFQVFTVNNITCAVCCVNLWEKDHWYKTII
jgi:hypothetical protein